MPPESRNCTEGTYYGCYSPNTEHIWIVNWNIGRFSYTLNHELQHYIFDDIDEIRTTKRANNILNYVNGLYEN